MQEQITTWTLAAVPLCKFGSPVIERLEHPERTWDQCEHRLPRLSWTSHDPLSFDFWSATQ